MTTWSMELTLSKPMSMWSVAGWSAEGLTAPLMYMIESGKGQAQSAVARAMSSDPAVRALSSLTEY